MTTPEELQAWRDAIGDKVSPGDVLAGKYRLDRLLGAGGMGAVVQAWHLKFDEAVAVKLLLSQVGASKNTLARFEREARAAFKIKSEHAARVLDIGFLDSGSPYIVMELLNGHDLGKELDLRGVLPVSEAVDHLLQACEAIAEAHTRGIVHRNLKPDNLFLIQGADGRPCVKVVDFGISKETVAEPEPGQPEGRQARALTMAGAALGTPLYMSTEQWCSAQAVGPATDIWSLGVILFELVSGKHPFVANDVRELFTAVMSAAPLAVRTFAPHVPAPLEAAIARCLEKDAANRFPSIADFAEAIAPFGSAGAQHSLERIRGVQRGARGTDGASTAARAGAAGGAYTTSPTPFPGQSPGVTGAGASGSVPARTVLGTPTGGGAMAASPAATGGGGLSTQQAWQQTGAPQPSPPRSKAPLVLGVAGVLAAIGIAATVLALRGSGGASAGGSAEASAEPPAAAATAVATAAGTASPSGSVLAELPAPTASGDASAAATASDGAAAGAKSAPKQADASSPATAKAAAPSSSATSTAKSKAGKFFTDM